MLQLTEKFERKRMYSLAPSSLTILDTNRSSGSLNTLQLQGKFQGAAQPQRGGGKLLLLPFVCDSAGKSLSIMGEDSRSPFGHKGRPSSVSLLNKELKYWRSSIRCLWFSCNWSDFGFEEEGYLLVPKILAFNNILALDTLLRLSGIFLTMYPQTRHAAIGEVVQKPMRLESNDWWGKWQCERRQNGSFGIYRKSNVTAGEAFNLFLQSTPSKSKLHFLFK